MKKLVQIKKNYKHVPLHIAIASPKLILCLKPTRVRINILMDMGLWSLI